MGDTGFSGALGGRIALAGFALGLLFLSYRVLHPFLVPLAWGLILVYVSWPLYRRLRTILGRFPNLGAFLIESDAVAGLRPAPAVGSDDCPVGSAAALQGGRAAAHPRTGDSTSRGSATALDRLELERLLALATEDPAGLRAQILQWGKPLGDDSLRWSAASGLWCSSSASPTHRIETRPARQARRSPVLLLAYRACARRNSESAGFRRAANPTFPAPC
jgi:hypothetical protein